MLQQADQTLSKLRQMIANGSLGTGGRIPPERTLASEMGVGRRSLRRALEILEQEGQITRHQGRGTFVQSKTAPIAAPTAVRARQADMAVASAMAAIPFDRILEFTNPLEVIEVRLAVEPVIARLAALRASQADIRRLQGLAEETRTATDPAFYERADENFHRAVAEAARNALFLSLFDTLSASRRDATWRRLSENAHCFKRQSVHSASHQEIYEAIAARNSERAFECMYKHLSDIQRHVYTYAFPAEQKSVAE
ncbi:FadR/GntR family transcriptional regulator [Dongia deserti]|uniref:FadR/GntR family transcriptional regulator n=1 Tax=Dongia deserti TaxID=2268030 RepID=UPI0013C46B35|nr:FadR/GntR family transcriptional regulator [Dongia deserti]